MAVHAEAKLQFPTGGQERYNDGKWNEKRIRFAYKTVVFVVARHQIARFAQQTQRGRNIARQAVIAQIYRIQHQLCQFSWNGTGKVVAMQSKTRERGEVAQLGWQRVGKIVELNGELLKRRQ